MAVADVYMGLKGVQMGVKMKGVPDVKGFSQRFLLGVHLGKQGCGRINWIRTAMIEQNQQL